MADTRIEPLLQLIGDERHIAAAPEDGADHAGERHDPRIMLEVLRVYEDLEWAPYAVMFDIVDRDVEGVLAVRPAQLVRRAGELLRADKQVRRGLGGYARRWRLLGRLRLQHRSSDCIGPVGRAALAAAPVCVPIDILERVEGQGFRHGARL